jgi:hypothetical protein
MSKKHQVSNYGDSLMEVVWLVAKKCGDTSLPLLPSDAKRFLFPSRAYSLGKIVRLLTHGRGKVPHDFTT